MSKQKRTDRTPERPEAHDRAKAPEIDPLLVEQGAVGNEAMQSLLGEPAKEPAVPLDVVRDVALPMVERAVLALELQTAASGRPERFVEILEASHLPEDRKQILVDKLQTDQAAVHSIGEAVARWFGPDASRSDVAKALDAVWAGLADGSAAGAGWRVGTHDVALSDASRDGAVSVRAEALVGDVAEAVVTGPARESASGGVAEAVRGLCRDVVLAFAFDEEEEEEEAVGWEMGAQEG